MTSDDPLRAPSRALQYVIWLSVIGGLAGLAGYIVGGFVAEFGDTTAHVTFAIIFLVCGLVVGYLAAQYWMVERVECDRPDIDEVAGELDDLMATQRYRLAQRRGDLSIYHSTRGMPQCRPVAIRIQGRRLVAVGPAAVISFLVPLDDSEFEHLDD